MIMIHFGFSFSFGITQIEIQIDELLLTGLNRCGHSPSSPMPRLAARDERKEEGERVTKDFASELRKPAQVELN